jgi:hypothetical protein
MTRAPLALSLGATLLLALGTIAAACGGSNQELTLEEYFLRFEELGDRTGEQLAALLAKLEVEPETEEERLAIFQDWFAASLQVQRASLDELDDINPPPEVEDAHQELLNARAALMDTFADLFGSLESESELEAVFLAAPDGQLIAAQERNFEACSSLQQIADANGFDVSVLDYCGQDETGNTTIQ